GVAVGRAASEKLGDGERARDRESGRGHRDHEEIAGRRWRGLIAAAAAWRVSAHDGGSSSTIMVRRVAWEVATPSRIASYSARGAVTPRMVRWGVDWSVEVTF